jgi:chitinase
MKKLLFPLLVSLLLSCQPEPTRVLVLYENAGHHKPFSEAVLPWLREIAPQENLVLTEVHNPKNFNEEYLAGFDVIVQLDYAPYGWPEEAVEAFEEYVDEGRGGWVGFHHASLLGEFDGFPMWDWFSGLLGGIRYENYIEPLTDGTVCVEDASHPVMAGVPATFVIQDDEFYTYDKSPRACPDVHVLATVDENSYTLDTPVKMGDHPVVWTNTARKGRNVYFQYGHSPKLADNEAFRTLLLNAIHWTSGK